MPHHSDRRTFLRDCAGGSATLLAAAALPLGTALAAPAPAPRSTHAAPWDDGWTQHLGPHRTVFDVADPDAEPGVGQVAPVMDSYKDVLGVSDADLGFVLVLRHFAVILAASDALWDKYALGQDIKHKDPKTQAPFTRNPAAPLVTALQKRGVVVLACNSALQGYGGMIAQRTGRTADVAAIRQELVAGLLPGAILLPNGLYALARAQDVGCGFMR